MLGFGYLFLFGGPPDVTRDIADYPQMLTKHGNVQTGFTVFPEELPESMLTEEAQFYYFYRDTWDDPTMEVILQCDYTKEAYDAELERLASVRKIYGDEEKRLLYSEDRCRYPAYIAMDGYNRGYEYALLTGENEITYLYFAFLPESGMRSIPKEYLPAGYAAEYRKDQQWTDAYCIYLDPVNSSEGVRFLDYTRALAK